MKISKSVASIGSLFGRLSGALPAVACSLAALAAFAPAANAAVTASPAVTPIVIPSNGIGIYINVVSGVYGATPASSPGWDINPYGTAAMSFFTTTASASNMVSGAPNSVAASLPVGTVIGGASTFAATGVTGTTFGALANQWTFNATNYFGFRFTGDDTLVHYGYGTMLIGATAATKSITSLFYESDALTAITAVPEASTTAMLLMGGVLVAGLGLRRRRQAV